MGIGGAGMSGLALLLRQIGMKISGCDVSHTYYINKISPHGIEFTLGHDKEHLDRFKPDAIVFSSAIPSETEELVEAARRGIRIFKRAEVLSWLFNMRKGIGVAGTHGKTTTASMIGLILESAGLDPSVAIGGEICDIGGNAKLGQGAHMVAELDESDGSFELFRPHVAIVTNADWDHVDYYPSFSSVLKAYERFLSNREPGGAAMESTTFLTLLQPVLLPILSGSPLRWPPRPLGHSRGQRGAFSTWDPSVHLKWIYSMITAITPGRSPLLWAP
ncbi:MAG: UDP-N-acetylmuramate--L-alanine ligase [Synergistales bacterium 57_84]|nr:MAG: UDP-N-acetylmuramate--L-alanine ligase [Synergistales bacterium 57_84]